MGILRTDKISGLETPTAVTGSVVFDGTGDYLDATVEVLSANNFTFEMWINTSDTSTGYLTVFEYGQHNSSSNGIICQVRNTGGVTGIYTRNGTTDTSGAGISSPYPIKVGEWNHIAITRDGTTVRLHVNGIYTGSGTWSKDFTATDLRIASARYLSGEHFDGYISNFRMLKGTALYGSADFTVPSHELEVIGDTLLLCCNNPDSAGAEATGKTITVNGDAAASTFSPGLTRDFTSGTQFEGVTTFDTQGYFVPPSGTTEQRGRGRGILYGGYRYNPNANQKLIEYIQISSGGNAQKFGDIDVVRYGSAGVSSPTRGVFLGGADPVTNDMDFITIATEGNPVDFGNATASFRNGASLSNGVRGVVAGKFTPSTVGTIDYITIAALGDAQDFGDLSLSRHSASAACSNTRGVIAGGYKSPAARDVIDYITIASTGNATDFGDLSVARAAMSDQTVCSETRGLFGGGTEPAVSTVIDFVTIASTGNAQDFGDILVASAGKGGLSNKIRGIFAGGYTPSPTTSVNTIEYVTIASTGNAQDFGDTAIRKALPGTCSDSHGGIS